MSLRRKNVIVIITTLIALVSILFFVSQLIILRQFSQQQEEGLRLNMDRALYAFDQQLDNLSSINSDWAYWDDTYQFVRDIDQAYINSNLADSTFENLQLDFMIFVNQHGEVIFTRAPAYDLEIPERTSQSAMLKSLTNMPTLEHVNRGIIDIAQNLALVTSRNILSSAMTGSPQGVLIVGRFLNASQLEKIGQQTQLSLALQSINTAQSSPDFIVVKSELTTPDAPSMIYRVSDHWARGYSLITDITGHPTAILQIQTGNRIYQAGKQAVIYVLIALLISGLVFGGVIIGLTERIVISRLAYMDHRIFEIGNSSDLSARIRMSGNDELTRLAATINDSLAKREHSQEQQLKELNTALTRVNTELNEKIADLNAHQKYKDLFFSHASHEFRTPLAVLRTRLYLARKKPEDWEKHVDSLEDTVDHLINIIDDIFDMTKLQDRNMTLNMQQVDLKTYVLMMIELQTYRLSSAGLPLQHKFGDGEFLVHLDVANFGRAFDKLMKYILDFSKPDNEVWIEIMPLDTKDTHCIALRLSSCGLVFIESEISEMFSPFFQVSEGTVRNTGLNMAIARQIAELHGGTLCAQNDPQKGGMFQINLPRLLSPK